MRCEMQSAKCEMGVAVANVDAMLSCIVPHLPYIFFLPLSNLRLSFSARRST